MSSSTTCATPEGGAHGRGEDIMPTTQLAPSRASETNPNHHLWNNHGTWFLHCTVHPTSFTKDRIRRSLGTKGIQIARDRRDSFFAHLASEATEPDGTLVFHANNGGPSTLACAGSAATIRFAADVETQKTTYALTKATGVVFAMASKYGWEVGD
jgi:hypothetical protein